MAAKHLTIESAYIFRITDVSNVRTIFSSGCQCNSASNGRTPFRAIGNLGLIAKRTTRPVPCAPGGTLDDYIPFYFTPYTPMMLNIKTGYNGVEKRPLSDLVILVSSMHKLQSQGVDFVFTDRHAYLKTAQFSNTIKDLDWILWQELRARNFAKTDVDRFEKYQAEALVYKNVPVSALNAILCYDSITVEKLSALAKSVGATTKVLEGREWYV